VPTAAEYAVGEVAFVRDDPVGRVALMRSLYEAPPGTLPKRSLGTPRRRCWLERPNGCSRQSLEGLVGIP
jgi:hypothetical protein